ncbi:hypothetical protein ACFQVC_17055 [Streptomyces monticola]|uniref:Uncharacterized protein n=1 Tax=Streptomyces monticola TaxID=2666263 RepID=A0ABW2JIJ6_9ACTN
MKWRGRGRWVASAMAVCGLALLQVPASAADEPSPYRFAKDAQRIDGAETPGDAPQLNPGPAYRSSIGPGRRLYYRVELDGASSAYASAVAVPGAGSQVAYGDGITVMLQDQQGKSCGSVSDASFGSADYPTPLAASVGRLIEEGSRRCQEPGQYYVLIQRESAQDSTRGDWDLELTFDEEPALASGGGRAPESMDPVAPPLPSGAAKRAAGGSGFNDARILKKGVWEDTLRPGESLFYRVPVDWGQQLSAQAELGSAPNGAGGGVGLGVKALNLTLHNPVRAPVTTAGTNYRGEPASAVLDAVAPVAYENRLASKSEIKEMRFPGSYYLKVTLDPKLREKYGDKGLPVTLSVGVTGQPKTDVAYAEDPGIFQVFDGGENAPVGGGGAEGDSSGGGGSDAMKVVAASGIGTGTLLVLVLVLWTVLARRHAASAAAKAAQAAQASAPAPAPASSSSPVAGQEAADRGRASMTYGPPQAW